MQFRGHLPKGEEFQWGFWLNATNITSESDANGLAATVNGAWTGTAKSITMGLLDPLSGMDEVRVYCYPTGGPTATYVGSSTESSVGTGTSSTLLPLQCAAVVSLRTGFAGRRARGRLYLPINRVPLSAFELSSTNVDPIAADFADFFSTINAVAGIGNVAVVSQVGAGQSRAVTEVVVDSRVDIQRRRANSMVVDYVKQEPVTV